MSGPCTGVCQRCGLRLSAVRRLNPQTKYCPPCALAAARDRANARNRRMRAGQSASTEDAARIERRYQAALRHIRAHKPFTIDGLALYRSSLPAPEEAL